MAGVSTAAELREDEMRGNEDDERSKETDYSLLSLPLD
jgi:hypothetical protein